MVNLMMNVDRKLWKKYICERIQEADREAWKDGCLLALYWMRLIPEYIRYTEMEKDYVRMKECPIKESFAYGSVGAGVRLMVEEDICQ